MTKMEQVIILRFILFFITFCPVTVTVSLPSRYRPVTVLGTTDCYRFQANVTQRYAT